CCSLRVGSNQEPHQEGRGQQKFDSHQLDRVKEPAGQIESMPQGESRQHQRRNRNVAPDDGAVPIERFGPDAPMPNQKLRHSHAEDQRAIENRKRGVARFRFYARGRLVYRLVRLGHGPLMPRRVPARKPTRQMWTCSGGLGVRLSDCVTDRWSFLWPLLDVAGWLAGADLLRSAASGLTATADQECRACRAVASCI